jgi:hypothetical protein
MTYTFGRQEYEISVLKVSVVRAAAGSVSEVFNDEVGGVRSATLTKKGYVPASSTVFAMTTLS